MAQLKDRPTGAADTTQEREKPDPLTAMLDAQEIELLREILRTADWHRSEELAAAGRPVLLRACASYLNLSPKRLSKADAVARFHLGNGARLQRLNWLANTSQKGLQESFGLMANYLYDPETIEVNHENFVRDGKIAMSDDLKPLLNPKGQSSILPIAGRRVRTSR
jgi:malonyl-CoA decarboxylase